MGVDDTIFLETQEVVPFLAWFANLLVLLPDCSNPNNSIVTTPTSPLKEDVEETAEDNFFFITDTPWVATKHKMFRI